MRITIDIKNFEDWLKVKGLKPRTIFEYKNYFYKFDFQDVTQEYVNKFIYRFNGHNIARAFLVNLFKYITRTTDYTEEVKTFVSKLYVENRTGRKRKRIKKVITEMEMRTMAKGMKSNRDRLILYVSFYCGLRVSELFGDKFNEYIKGISYKDFNLNSWYKEPSKDAEVRVIGKGNKERVVAVPSWLMVMIYKVGTETNCKRNDKLFKIKESRWAKILSKASTDALGYSLNPHALRSSYATWLFLIKKSDIVEVMDLLGHDDISTTRGYLDYSKKMKKKYGFE